MFLNYIKYLLFCLIFVNVSLNADLTAAEQVAQSAYRYFINEVELDPTLTHEKQYEKIQEFKNFAASLTPDAASRLTRLLLDETRLRILDICLNAELNLDETDLILAEYEKAIHNTQNMNVEMAWQMLFFVAELKIHRQYVYDFGVALGCPKKQLLRHDLCKLSSCQFEGYARYFRGGKREEDRKAYLASWEIHQLEDHHLESYSRKGIEHYSDEQLRNNMLEAASDLLASTKQRGGGTLINYLVNAFPKKNPHPRLIPFLKEALKKAHAYHLAKNDSLFDNLPCWNSDVEDTFSKLTFD